MGFSKEPIIGPLKFKMADIRHLENVKSLYFNEKSSDFGEIWYTSADLELDDSHDQILTFCMIFFKFKMVDSRHIVNR